MYLRGAAKATLLLLFLEKSTKLFVTVAALFGTNIHQIVCRLYWGSVTTQTHLLPKAGSGMVYLED